MTDPKPKDLTPRQWMFVQEYVKSGNATDAARKAGYSENTANEQAHQLLAKLSVSNAVSSIRSKLAEKFEITQERIIERLAAIAFAKVSDYASWDGTTDVVKYKSSKDLTARQMDSLEHVEQGISESGDRYIKIRQGDRIKALLALGKHLGLFENAGSGNGQDARSDAMGRVRDHLKRVKKP